MTIVIDTNVIISALLFGGNPHRVLEMVLTQTVRMAVSRGMLDEVVGVLQGRKFGYPHEVAPIRTSSWNSTPASSLP